MKKLLITVCLSGLLSVPSVVLGAEMAGATSSTAHSGPV